MGTLYIGTSGWMYPEWQGSVYPKKLKAREIFPFYKSRFGTVELNSTFYHFPSASTVKKWKELGGGSYVWSVKAWRWVTHVRKLHKVKKDLNEFLARVQPLSQRKGVVLFQLPPNLKINLPRLESFLKLIPKKTRTAVEFRHASWFTKPVYALLKKYGVALVSVDAPGIEKTFEVRTARFAYFRLHGSKRWYNHNYSRTELHRFAQFARKHRKQGDVYIYFDNTARGDAFHNALELKKMMR